MMDGDGQQQQVSRIISKSAFDFHSSFDCLDGDIVDPAETSGGPGGDRCRSTGDGFNAVAATIQRKLADKIGIFAIHNQIAGI